MGEVRELREAARILKDARSVLVLTGAGISAESGVPTFRGPEGLWRNHRPEELATPEAFARDPRLVWEWYEWRRRLVEACDPNPAHHALARAAMTRPGMRILTQNVDGLHDRAAREEAERLRPDAEQAAAATPLELHGSVLRARCTSCQERVPLTEPLDTSHRDTLPRCDGCRALLRPDVVWFGEALDPAILDEAFHLAEEADLCLVIGTSAVVQPTASLPRVTQSNGGRVIEINPEPTPLTMTADLSLRATAVEAVPGIVAAPRGGAEA